MRAAEPAEQETAWVRDRNRLGRVRHGTTVFVLEMFARVVRMNSLEADAKMRGERFEDVMKNSARACGAAGGEAFVASLPSKIYT